MPPLTEDVAKKWRTRRYPVAQDITQQKQETGNQLNQRIFDGHRFVAILAFAANHEPTEDRKILPKESEFMITRRATTCWCK